MVIEIKDHQNPSQDPLMNERGNSSLFQYVSYKFRKYKGVKKLFHLVIFCVQSAMKYTMLSLGIGTTRIMDPYVLDPIMSLCAFVKFYAAIQLEFNKQTTVNSRYSRHLRDVVLCPEYSQLSL